MTELIIILIVAAAALAVAYPALRREDTPARPGEEEPLIERKARVLSALREIESDRAEGNLSEEDYLRLKREYEAEAAAILRRLDAAGEVGRRVARPAEPAKPARSRIPSGLAWGFGIVLFAVLVGVTLTQAIRPREPGGSITGNEPAGGGGGGGGGAGGGMGGALVPVDLSRVPVLEARLEADSTDVDALVELAHIHLSTQRFGEVADLSMQALRVDPRNAQALTHLGVVLWAGGDLEGAVQAFDHALEFDPDLPEALLFKGIVLFAGNRDFQGAVEAWERYLEVAPPEANTDRVRGMLEGARQAAAMGGVSGGSNR